MLRYYAGWIQIRVAACDIQYKQYTIKQGSMFAISPCTLTQYPSSSFSNASHPVLSAVPPSPDVNHRNAVLFENPFEFDINNFYGKPDPEHDELLTFSGGKHKCLGRGLVLRAGKSTPYITKARTANK